MNRQFLISQLKKYQAQYNCINTKRTIDFVKKHPNCCQRELEVGHVTSSSLLLDQTGEKTLLTLHKKLGYWVQLGGHMDDTTNPLKNAIKEAKEESGINSIVAIMDKIFDIEIHTIPEYGDTPQHLHFDLCYLLQVTSNEQYKVSDESIDLGWFDIDSPQILQMNDTVQRLVKKYKTSFVELIV